MPTQSDDLESADSVAITFEMQTNYLKHDNVIHGRTYDSVLCPVLEWARLVIRIWTYPGNSLDTPVCSVWRNGRMEHITSKSILEHLQSACSCSSYGSARLGFEPHEVGTHSLRSGAAMEMYLGEIPIYIIMLIGRWSSDTFLPYIRKQVEQFLRNVSKKMLRSFCHIPDIAPRRISSEDPRQRNHHNNAETRRNIGGDKSRRAQLPAFSLYT
jgi:hypothetical protein